MKALKSMLKSLKSLYINNILFSTLLYSSGEGILFLKGREGDMVGERTLLQKTYSSGKNAPSDNRAGVPIILQANRTRPVDTKSTARPVFRMGETGAPGATIVLKLCSKRAKEMIWRWAADRG